MSTPGSSEMKFENGGLSLLEPGCGASPVCNAQRGPEGI